MPGSGIPRQRPSFDVLKVRLAKPKLPTITLPRLSFSAKLPKQWRHLMIASLAMLVAMIGVGKQTINDSRASASSLVNPNITTPPLTNHYANFLPAVKSIALPPVPVKKPNVRAPVIAASGAILFDDTSKLPLYEKASAERRAVASTTKIITAQVVINSFKDLDQRVVVGKDSLNQIGSGVGFHPGETVTIRQLLYGLLMVSGNDAATQLSELYLPEGGQASTQAFTAEMNNLALRLGMTSSRFYDPAGLNDQAYSTPNDMAKAMSELLKNPELVKIIGTANYAYNSPENFTHSFKNSNRLVTDEMLYAGIIGGKTGFTPETQDGGAGHCLIVAAERGGHRLIAAVYGTYNSAPQASAEVARTLLDYGFTSFSWVNIPR